jgi:spermidine synthase
MVLAGAFLTGLTVLLYEVVATKALFYFFNDSTYSAATVLAVFLLGLAIGSIVFGKIERRFKNKQTLFYLAHWAAAGYALLVLPHFDLIPGIIDQLYDMFGQSFEAVLVVKLIVSLIYLIIPTVILGMLFPLLLTFGAKSTNPAKTVSTIYAFDLFGALSGALLAGFVLIPTLGVTATMYVGGILNIIAGLVFSYKVKRVRIVNALLVVVVIVVIIVIATPKRPSAKTSELTPAILMSAQSPFGEVEVARSIEDGQPVVSLLIEKRLQCNNKDWDKKNVSEVHIAQDALALSKDDSLNVLSIGLGCGITTGVLASSPQVEHIDVVEINPEVPGATSHFNEWNSSVLENEKVNVIIADGYEFLRRNTEKYDLIVVDIESPEITYATSLYTLEFFELVNKTLTPNGLFALWAYKESEQFYSIVFQTLQAAFKDVTFKVSGVYQDAYFFGAPESLKTDQISLSKKDLDLIARVAGNESVELNTLDHPSLLNEWLRSDRD